ncbi:hypothetical protein CQW23_20829 [Capsicum baccatum]|uniref:AB hydrolase-1 domain-containing protein n=1 Tax=Capsicum baccatum TaxID=33114 RepID=A0A2G2W9R8_CAPBA|nr:hypothetical protein CQW23_20829 [Capsicum baccatum]
MIQRYLATCKATNNREATIPRLSLARTALLHGRSNAKKHFVLVHKACFGVWSCPTWYKILALMRSLGHNVTAIDLGSSGINPKQTFEIPRFSDYLSPLMEFMASLPANRKVVLVGHELGGLAISKAMETFPEKISVAIFVTALMPGPNLNVTTIYTEFVNSASQPDNRVIYDNGPTNPPTTFIIGPKYLETNLYQRSPSQASHMLSQMLSSGHVRLVRRRTLLCKAIPPSSGVGFW